MFIQNVCFNFRDCMDGLGTTTAVGERYRNTTDTTRNSRYRAYFCMGTTNARNQHSTFSGSIGRPFNNTTQDQEGFVGFQSAHPGGVQFVMMDGAVRFVSDNLDNLVRMHLGTKDGLQTVGDF
jgi:hypothetical protein